jgi:hypothetical protein
VASCLRLRTTVTCAFAAAIFVLGCGAADAAQGGSGAGGSTSGTKLTMVALNAHVGRAVFQLSCAPPGGDIPDPSRACAALDLQPGLVTSPQPAVCRGGPGSHWYVTVSGSLNGQPIHESFTTCWDPLRMPTIREFGLTWEVLRRHLVPRRHKTVRPGTRVRFAPGVLRAADLVTCNILGHHLELGVPVETWGRASVGYGGRKPVVLLTVAHNRDGSVTASCHRGKR